jgi:hypothetical protein
MSDELRDALRVLRRLHTEMETPLVYLHDPDTGEIFAGMIDPTLFNSVVDRDDPAGGMAHGHLEGAEDEDPA